LRLLTFKGGIHPKYRKELAKDSPIKRIEPPEFVYLPLSQHTGTPSKPIIEKKTEVELGMKIAESSGKLSVPLHSSVSGTYMGLENWPHPLGGRKPAMKIKVDTDKTTDWKGGERDINGFSKDEIVEIIRESGIVGMGGAAFPTYFKMRVTPNKKIEDLIINGAECEPYLTADYRIMLERTEDIFKGIEILRKVISPERTWIAVEDNKEEAIEKLKEISKSFPWANITIHKTKYPQGSEKQLIASIAGKEVPEGGLPFDVGTYVQNVGTIIAIYEALRYSKPLYERVVTVTGPLRDPSNFLVPIGTPFKYLIEASGGVMGDMIQIINGGPMMGIAQIYPEVPVIKGTTGILVRIKKDIDRSEVYPCIRCASCVEVCPMYLMPTEIYKFIELENFEKAEELGVLSCMECGSCGYVCPSNIPLPQQFKFAKSEIVKKRK
jgi:electron transport complex protein RnfC